MIAEAAFHSKHVAILYPAVSEVSIPEQVHASRVNNSPSLYDLTHGTYLTQILNFRFRVIGFGVVVSKNSGNPSREIEDPRNLFFRIDFIKIWFFFRLVCQALAGRWMQLCHCEWTNSRSIGSLLSKRESHYDWYIGNPM